MDMMSNKKKRKTSKKSATSRARRGLTAARLPFRAKTYGKNLPAWAKELGWTGDTVPVVSLVPAPKSGMYSLLTGGTPADKKKGPKRPRVSKEKRLLNQFNKVHAELVKAAAKGAGEKRINEISARLEKLKKAILDEAVFQAKVAAKIAGSSPKAIEREMRREARQTAQTTGGTPQQVQSSVQQAAGREVTDADRRAAAQAAASVDTSGFAGFGSPGFAAAVEESEAARAAAMDIPTMRSNPYYDDLDLNPEVMFQRVTGRGKKARSKRTYLNLEPATRGTEGAVTVVVGPQAYRYATLALKEVKKNGLYSRSKHMAKRRMHANPLTDDLMALGKPVLGATAGFAASRAVNALALMGVAKMAKEGERPSKTMEGIARLAATGAGIAATLTVGNNVALIRNNRTSIVTGMALNLIEGLVRRQAESMLAEARDDKENPYLRDMALGTTGYYDVSHAGAPYSPMMGEYVSQSLNGGMGSYIAQAAAGMGEYVSQSLNGGDGLGEYVSQSLNGLGEYAEGVDPSDQEGVDGMINNAEAVAGLSGTEVMAATAGLGATEVMAATAGLGNVQGMNRGIVTRRGVYNFFTQPVTPGRANIPAVSIEDAPMPVVNMGGAVPGAVPLSDQVSTPEGRGYAGGIFGRHIFGTMV